MWGILAAPAGSRVILPVLEHEIMSASNVTAIPLCVYPISGWYGPIPRYVFYAILILFILSRRISWLVGAAMTYSCVAAIHGCAIAAGRGRGVVDLDVIPIFAIVGIGLFVMSTLLFWSKTARYRPTGRLLFVCTLVLWAGVVACTVSLKAVPKRSHCGFTWIPESPTCTRTCQNITLPMRDQQTTFPFVFLWRSMLYDYSGWFTSFSITIMCLGHYAYFKMRSDEDPWDLGRRTHMNSRVEQKQHARVLCYAMVFPVLGIPHIIITEFVMLVRKGMPVNANYSTVGQWGILVGAFVGGVGSLLALSIRADSKIGTASESAAVMDIEAASESPADAEIGAASESAARLGIWS